MMGKPHAVAVPFPGQGHVLPLMELSHRLVDRGFGITMVCSEFDKARILAALKKEDDQRCIEGISLVAVSDGMGTDDDRGDVGRLSKFVMGADFERFLENLMRQLNEREEEKVSCVIADVCCSAALSVAKKLGIPGFGFCPAAVADLALCLHIPKLVESGFIADDTGNIVEDQTFRITPTMPEMSTSYFGLNGLSASSKRTVFLLMDEVCRVPTLTDRILCNSFRGIESPALDSIPQAVPIGPLLPPKRAVTKAVPHFWAEDSSCLTWLDQQQDRSVIYVSFGSFSVLNQAQFEEIAAGLEQSGRPFLWVVRPNLMTGSAVVYPENFLDRVGERGKIVSWAPQQKVLAHRAVACFLSHCGWNSTLEGLSNGVPFLCWPFMGDQFLNKNYICEVWKIGLELKAEEKGIITREEIQRKIEELLCDDRQGIRTRALKMKETAEEAVGGGGTSRKNFDDFVEEIKRENLPQ
ncbi:hypothetical protein H6P81_020753 [Aristolochia fimbriata]|uniref:Glycosyltransferase n=1 Tax=Aristolochia fimbriata TaxID=158543 RepID=A0AAV7DVG8_ARIFI|nr:hypothetical protein H6P81_020753 [Aristolochia fimbriata]